MDVCETNDCVILGPNVVTPTVGVTPVPGELANTGVDGVVFLGLGLILLVAGVLLLIRHRKAAS